MAALLALAFLVGSLLLGLLVPVYTDEVAWRFQARAAFDGGVDRGLGDSCGANTVIAPPAFILPLRHLSAFLNSAFADPMFVRLGGVATALLWVGLFWLLAGRIAANPAAADRSRAIGLSLLGLGVLPLLLVWSRPEQAILLTVTLAIIIASRRWVRTNEADDTILSASLASAAVLLLALVAIGYHLKGIVYLPVFGACILIASWGRGALIPRMVALAVLVVLASIAFEYWTTRFQCPGDPLIAAKLAKENVASILFDPSRGPFVSRLAASDLGGMSPAGYVQQTLPRPSYMAQWLPARAIGDTAATIWSTPIVFAWLFASATTLLCLFLAMRNALRTRSIDPRLAAALVLLAVLLGWSSSQLNKNSYESALVLPAAVMTLLLAIEASRPTGWVDRALSKLPLLLLPIAIVSQLALALTYAPPLWRSSSQPGYIWSQFFSISPYGYSRLAPEIVSAGRKCGIDPAKRPRALLVDDLTYFTYMHSWRPLHRLGTLDVWNGSIRDPLAYLRSRRSDGAVIACAYLPEDMRARAIQTGHFCCIGLGDKAQGTR